MITDTIVAQCTPQGSGALALLRISGPDAITIASICARLSSKKNLKNVSTHTIHHGWITNNNNEILDEVMFFVMHGPRTFTGETTVEITTHNNPFIVQNVLERILQCGARIAHNGEFTRQSVENGKRDLIQAEAINELIHANSQQVLQQSLKQMDGSFSNWIQELEKGLLKLISLCEASFEFLEEDIDFTPQIEAALITILSKIENLKKSFDIQQQLRQGIRIALVGSVNTGKSSLFNALIKKDRAIVTSIAGTTRDSIEAGMYSNGTYWTFIDTAGLRKTNNIVEKEGIERSFLEAKLADIVLLVWDGSRVMTTEEKAVYAEILTTYKEKTLLASNKFDAPQKKNSLFENAFFVSTQSGDGIEKLNVTIQEKAEKLFKQDSSPFLLNKRHYSLLVNCENELNIIINMLKSPEYELIAHHLRHALSSLIELTGKSVTEKVFNTIFNDFCIGK
ncbi:tRNA uridine-5-carboxymethylaminomethyl(34) synthesis GTPase MnmE [Candidatus Babeliales bacterium]|nr:tRNA uridine-5-carboxymethylaminomethyl(34) synthesis GTPase MnmE [Candidatus Babeliales bacterium]